MVMDAGICEWHGCNWNKHYSCRGHVKSFMAGVLHFNFPFAIDLDEVYFI